MNRAAVPESFSRVDAVTHDGIVVAFGEQRGSPSRLWYRVLDLQQTADDDQAGTWEDATRWTRWYEVPWPTELRAVGSGLLTIDKTVDHRYSAQAGRWKALGDGSHIYLFRALELSEGVTRVYANRYSLRRLPSPDAGTSKGTGGREVTVPQLVPAREARYRRSGVREVPLTDTDGQGTRDISNQPFVEPTMEWSMLRPLDGGFTVALTPSDIPGRQRWQFICAAEQLSADGSTPAMSLHSILRDEDGWADLTDKLDQLDVTGDPGVVAPDALVTLQSGSKGILRLDGQPDALTFRLQEQGSGPDDEESRAVSGQRVLVASRVTDEEDPETGRLLVMDFGLDETGTLQAAGTVTVPDVDFARTALWLNSAADRVELSPERQASEQATALSVHAWVRRDGGSGTILSGGGADGDDSPAWSIEWRGSEIVGLLRGAEVTAPAPASFSWHHLALVHDEERLELYVDARLEGSASLPAASTETALRGPVVVGASVSESTGDSWLDLRIDQVIVWTRAVEPSLDTIFNDLGSVERNDDALVGCWTFDRETEASGGYTVEGADVVSQTAPLFAVDRDPFEPTLGDVSVGMGLLDVPSWRLQGDPQLYIGADGLVRLYTVAARNDGAPTDTVAGELVYDTTTTRAQFVAEWEAAGDQSVEQGEFVFQARVAGPVMNRATIAIADGDGDALTVEVRHPHRPDLDQTYADLPRDLAGFTETINDTDAGLIQVLTCRPPDNGVPPKVRTGRTMLHQQGNFTGWTRAPLAVAGRFGDTGYGAFAVSVDLSDGEPERDRLRIPGDFAVEAWVHPGASAGEQRVINWLQEEHDGFSLGLEPKTALRLSDDVLPSIDLGTTPAVAAPGSALELTTEVRLPLQSSPATGTSLLAYRVEGEAIFDLKALIEYTGQLREAEIGDDPELAEGLAAWQDLMAGLVADLEGLVRMDVEVEFGLGLAGSNLFVSHDDMVNLALVGDPEHWDHDSTPTEFVEEELAPFWADLVSGRSASPPAVDWSIEDSEPAVAQPEPSDRFGSGPRRLVEIPLTAGRGDRVRIRVRIEAGVPEQLFGLTLGRGSVTCLVDDEPVAEFAPSADELAWLALPDDPTEAQVIVGRDTDGGDPPFSGIVDVVGVASSPRPVGHTKDPALEVDFRTAAPDAEDPDHVTVVAELGDGAQRPLVELAGEAFAGAFTVRPTIGDRRFETQRDFASGWTHLAVVCSDNFAVRFAEDGDRAVISDAAGLNPDRAFTIDAVVVVDDPSKGGTVFAKAVEVGEDTFVTFRLSVDDERPTLEYSVALDDERHTRIAVGPRLEAHKPYHLVATASLEELHFPRDLPEPSDPSPPTSETRYQLWAATAHVCAFDLIEENWVDGQAPADFDEERLRADLHNVLLAFYALIPAKWSGLSGAQLARNVAEAEAADAGLVKALADHGGLLSVRVDSKPVHAIRIRPTGGPAAIGAATGEDMTRVEPARHGWFRGLIGSVRMWGSRLAAHDIARMVGEPGRPISVDLQPAAWWRLDENRGLHAEDSAGGMHAVLTREQMWETSRATARLELYVNGRPVALTPARRSDGADADRDRGLWRPLTSAQPDWDHGVDPSANASAADRTDWRRPQYSGTIQTAQIGDRLLLLGRTVDGIDTWEFDPVAEKWELLSTDNPQLSDTHGWGNPKYYSTNQTATITADGVHRLLLLARHSGGMRTWEFDPTTNAWLRLETAELTALSNAHGWDQHKKYSTIQTATITVDGVQRLLLLTKANLGMLTYEFDANTDTWGRLETADMTDLSDAHGWRGRQFYSTIQTATITTDGVQRLLLLARDATGMLTWEFDPATDTWDVRRVATPAWTDGWHPNQTGAADTADWRVPGHYATIQTATVKAGDAERLILIGRTVAGVDSWEFDPGYDTWRPLDTGRPDWHNGGTKGAGGAEETDWMNTAHYPTIQLAAGGGGARMLLLGRTVAGVDTWELPVHHLGADPVDYGRPDQFSIGGYVADPAGTAAATFDGLVDDVRVWRDLRTNEEILDDMHVRLGGREDDLAAWWPFSAGAGIWLKDATGGGNDAALTPAPTAEVVRGFWARDDAAPVGDDLPQVCNLLGGMPSAWTARRPQAPAFAAEYGDIQTDSRGQLAGVQKRALVVATDRGALSAGARTPSAFTGFKTGDVDIVYVGQAQSDPTLIGYIEGAPPVPSENLTRAHWTNPSAYNAYSGNTSITLEEAENTVALYKADFDRGFDSKLSTNQGLTLGQELTVGAGWAGLAFGDVEIGTLKLEVGIGQATELEHSLAWQRTSEAQVHTTTRMRNTLALGGSWEDERDGEYPDLGRRYVPDNVGYALVRSGVANVYAMRLRRTGALLGLTMIPDPDIAEDFNILTFRIRSTYTKQGTLDGMVGHRDDPDWPEALGRGSYVRPGDVANLEAEIKAQHATWAAAHEGFDAGDLGRREAGSQYDEDEPARSPARVVGDNATPGGRKADPSVRSIVNTYVWTASGGLFAEEVSVASVRSESVGGRFSFKTVAGPKISTSLTFPGGGTSFDLSALFGGHIEKSVVKTTELGRSFGLDVDIQCDDLLEVYTGDPDAYYSGENAPGKVLGYRLKSFYLVPDKDHFDHFWDSVVDEDWLGSVDPDAVALSQAMHNVNAVWRAFHRVTYVSRVLPEDGAGLPEPAAVRRSAVHRSASSQLVAHLAQALRTATGDALDTVSPEQIAVAVDDVVSSRWAGSSPWWGDEPDPVVKERTVEELRRRVVEYIGAYEETGLLAELPPISGAPTSGAQVVLHLPLDDWTGTTAVDTSGHGNHGTLVNGARFEATTPDGSRSSVWFDGDDSRIDVPAFDVTGAGLTLAAWFRVHRFAERRRGSSEEWLLDSSIISKATGTDDDEYVFMLGTVARSTRSGTPRRGSGRGGHHFHGLGAGVRVDGSSTVVTADAVTIEVDTWYHAAVTYDGSALTLYLDGVEVGSTPLTGTVDRATRAPVAIGDHPAEEGDCPFHGLIDDIRILERALSQAEIDLIVGRRSG